LQDGGKKEGRGEGEAVSSVCAFSLFPPIKAGMQREEGKEGRRGA